MITGGDLEQVRTLYDAFARRDLETIRAAMTPDVVIDPSPGLPWSGTHQGPAGLMAFFGSLLSHLDTHLEIEDIFDAGDAVVQVGYSHGQVLASGTEFRTREIHVLQMRDGKVSRLQIRVDVAAMHAALAGRTTPDVTR